MGKKIILITGADDKAVRDRQNEWYAEDPRGRRVGRTGRDVYSALAQDKEVALITDPAVLELRQTNLRSMYQGVKIEVETVVA